MFFSLNPAVSSPFLLIFIRFCLESTFLGLDYFFEKCVFSLVVYFPRTQIWAVQPFRHVFQVAKHDPSIWRLNLIWLPFVINIVKKEKEKKKRKERKPCTHTSKGSKQDEQRSNPFSCEGDVLEIGQRDYHLISSFLNCIIFVAKIRTGMPTLNQSQGSHLCIQLSWEI